MSVVRRVRAGVAILAITAFVALNAQQAAFAALTVTPNSNLPASANVNVSGNGFTAHQPGTLQQCKFNAVIGFDECKDIGSFNTNASGSFGPVPATVTSTYVSSPPENANVSCLTGPACRVVASLNNVFGVQETPISFAGAVPTTSATTTTSIVATTTSSTSTTSTVPTTTSSTSTTSTVPTTTSSTSTTSTVPTTTSSTTTTTINPLVCDGLTATIVGTSGNDSLFGTPGDDVIVGLGGDDFLAGLGGNDRICGGDGYDRIAGGEGADRLFGGNGPDDIAGENGDDLLIGGGGADRLAAGAGNDTLNGGTETDACVGGDGTDVVTLCEQIASVP